jgi:hypothetical protein
VNSGKVIVVLLEWAGRGEKRDDKREKKVVSKAKRYTQMRNVIRT